MLEDRDGRLLRPAILWNDQRSGAEAAELQASDGERILATTLNRPTPTWTLPQLLWLARHEPGIVERTHRLYVAKDWLRTRLTGGWETDRTEAVGTLMYDVPADRWSHELCTRIGWNPATLPPIVGTAQVVGEVTSSAAAASGLRAGTPVVCGTSDTSIETFGVGSVAPGDGTIKLGSGAVMMLFMLLGGLYTPIESMPEWAKWITKINPVAYFIEVMRMIVLKGSGFADVKVQFFSVLGLGIFFNTWAVINYRKRS